MIDVDFADSPLDSIDPPELVMTIEEAARVLRIGRTKMCELIASGAVRSIQIGRLRRIPSECLAEYVKASLRSSTDTRAA